LTSILGAREFPLTGIGSTGARVIGKFDMDPSKMDNFYLHEYTRLNTWNGDQDTRDLRIDLEIEKQRQYWKNQTPLQSFVFPVEEDLGEKEEEEKIKHALRPVNIDRRQYEYLGRMEVENLQPKQRIAFYPDAGALALSKMALSEGEIQ